MKNKLIILILTLMSSMLQSQILSSLEIYDLQSNERTIVLCEDEHIEAPNWSRDAKDLIYNSNGSLFKVNIASKEKSKINTGFARKLNNDHGISPDGSQIVISCADLPDESYEDNKFSEDWKNSRIYLIPYTGGSPRLLTEKAPSFWHGWSPDGRNLAYTALRNGDFDIYTIDINGGKEKQLTSSVGLDDGPDYSPDGKFIYYNSFQSGIMEIWRMNADGKEKIQMTDDPFSNWFPHPSPDGKKLLYISYFEDQGSNHPPMKNVALKLYDLQNHTIKTLCSFTGGQGSINVPSWSPDGEKFAFVSYKEIKMEKNTLEEIPNMHDKVIISAPIILKKFTRKNAETMAFSEMYIQRSIQDYFIKFCESKVSRKEIEKHLSKIDGDIKSLTLEVEFSEGAWDICDENELMQSRIGPYVIIHRILTD